MNPSSKLVMIIDDNDATREAFTMILGHEGYRVAHASNGQDALDQLREQDEQPCVILLDLMMPVMDGWQFRAAQRQDSRTADIPVIVCTAAGEIQRRSDLNANRYLAKPIDVRELLAAVRDYCC